MCRMKTTRPLPLPMTSATLTSSPEPGFRTWSERREHVSNCRIPTPLTPLNAGAGNLGKRHNTLMTYGHTTRTTSFAHWHVPYPTPWHDPAATPALVPPLAGASRSNLFASMGFKRPDLKRRGNPCQEGRVARAVLHPRSIRVGRKRARARRLQVEDAGLPRLGGAWQSGSARRQRSRRRACRGDHCRRPRARRRQGDRQEQPGERLFRHALGVDSMRKPLCQELLDNCPTKK